MLRMKFKYILFCCLCSVVTTVCAQQKNYRD